MTILVLMLASVLACEKTKPATKAHEHKEGDGHEHKEADGHDHDKKKKKK
jgi:hypothetical protein